MLAAYNPFKPISSNRGKIQDGPFRHRYNIIQQSVYLALVRHQRAPMKIPPVFTPDNEPYLGLESVLWFDRIICWSMESNTQVAAWTLRNSNTLTPLQRAACQILPQGVGIALSIRELIRQAYLFSALILVRSLIERAAVVSYLDAHPTAVAEWENCWRY